MPLQPSGPFDAMTSIFITIDTEYEPGFIARAGSKCRLANFDRSIRCVTDDGETGICWQMDRFYEYGLKAVFFVDPMPALLWGRQAVADVVGPIMERGHDVQLHLHTEWLAHAGDANPLGDRTGDHLKDFTLEEQRILLQYAIETLVSAGAPQPVAFRAGNYGANDDTLRALAKLGVEYDTSHNPGFIASDCEIGLGTEDRLPVDRCGIVEVPIGCIGEIGQGLRHAQITALSLRELKAAIRHARDCDLGSFTLVSHSFELLSRDRKRINKVVRQRFEKLCRFIAEEPGVRTATYRDDPPRVPRTIDEPAPVLPPSTVRTSLRYAEQAVANALYGGKWAPDRADDAAA